MGMCNAQNQMKAPGSQNINTTETQQKKLNHESTKIKFFDITMFIKRCQMRAARLQIINSAKSKSQSESYPKSK